MQLRFTIALTCSLWAIICLTGCQPSKKSHQDRLYLQGIDTSLLKTVAVPEPQLQIGESISIVVYSDNPDATAPYNQIQTLTSTSKSPAEGSSNLSGYMVDEQGNIVFHDLGVIHVQGLTKAQLKQQLQDRLKTYLSNPYVEIHFLNKRVTILGEVNKPGVINIPEERLSLLDALALSGDLGNFSRKDNILVIREENGIRTSHRLDIKDPNIFKSPYFYLQRDDVVYVEPNRKKPTGNDQLLVRNISVAAVLISTLAVVYSVFRH